MGPSVVTADNATPRNVKVAARSPCAQEWIEFTGEFTSKSLHGLNENEIYKCLDGGQDILTELGCTGRILQCTKKSAPLALQCNTGVAHRHRVSLGSFAFCVNSLTVAVQRKRKSEARMFSAEIATSAPPKHLRNRT